MIEFFSPALTRELFVFLVSAFWGMLAVVYFDFFRILRILFHHTTAMVALEDLLFTLGAGCMVVVVIDRYSSGALRGYIFLGYFLGILLYNYGISVFILKIVKKFYNKGKEVLKKFVKQSKMKSNHYTKEGKHE